MKLFILLLALMPSGWYRPAWVFEHQLQEQRWLLEHQSPNSACESEQWAELGTRGPGDISCDGRLQIFL